MKTREQKKKEIKLGKDLLAKAKSLVFIDFTGVPTLSLNKLKKELKKAGATFRVIKKRLLGVALKRQNHDVDPVKFNSQVGAVFANGDISSVASIVHKFQKDLVKEKKTLNIWGAYELDKKNFLNVESFTAIAKLPSREVLLQLLMGAMTGPLRAFMHISGEIAKKKESVKTN